MFLLIAVMVLVEGYIVVCHCCFVLLFVIWRCLISLFSRASVAFWWKCVLAGSGSRVNMFFPIALFGFMLKVSVVA
jgi:hypothetical protein